MAATKTPRTSARKTAAKAAPKTSARKPATRKAAAQRPRKVRGLAAYAIGALTVAGGAVLAAVVARTLAARPHGGEHVPTDLMRDTHPSASDRAIDAFRPDPTAPVPASERESLRPATGPAPTLVAAE